MGCIHTYNASQKINDLIEKINQNDPSVIEELEIGPCVQGGINLNDIDIDEEEVNFTTVKLKRIRMDNLYNNYLIAMHDELVNCDCTSKIREQLNADLQIITNNKDHELQKKERKIKELKELLGKSREEILDYKLRAKEGRLETFVQKLEVDRAKIRELKSNYQQMIRIGANINQDDIDDLENKIESIKDELIDKGISIVDAQKLCSKCEKIAKLKVEQDELYKERFEARQEFPTT